MKWNIDREIAKLEPETAKGTSITRILMGCSNALDLDRWKKLGIKPTEAQLKAGCANIWCVAIGYSYAAKAFFYGQTIREAFLKARRAAKSNELAKHTPWDIQAFQPKIKKAALKRKKTTRPRKAASV